MASLLWEIISSRIDHLVVEWAHRSCVIEIPDAVTHMSSFSHIPFIKVVAAVPAIHNNSNSEAADQCHGGVKRHATCERCQQGQP